jgi:hypothetical protein
MPSYRGGVHQAGRKRRKPRVRAEGLWFGMGKQSLDEHWGIYWPDILMVDQDGFKVSARLQDESLDLPPEY